MKNALIHFCIFLLVGACGQVKPDEVVARAEPAVPKYQNKLDTIDTAAGIEALLYGIDRDYMYFKLNTDLKFQDRFNGPPGTLNQFIADSLKIRSWSKADFDGNGFTDVLMVGTWGGSHSVICMLDSGENHFYATRLTVGHFQECTFPLLASVGNTPVILYYSRVEPDWQSHKKDRPLKVDTLVFKMGDFVEYNRKPLDHHIEKMQFVTDYCYGTCPVFTITLDADRQAVYKAGEFNRKSGNYTTLVDTLHFRELMDMVNYLDFSKLDSTYAVGWTDDQTSDLKIVYDHGKIKTIHDYGMSGSFGLIKTYALLSALRKNQDWKKIRK